MTKFIDACVTQRQSSELLTHRTRFQNSPHAPLIIMEA